MLVVEELPTCWLLVLIELVVVVLFKMASLLEDAAEEVICPVFVVESEVFVEVKFVWGFRTRRDTEDRRMRPIIAIAIKNAFEERKSLVSPS